MKEKDMKFGTKAIHAGIEPDPSTGAIMTPIFQTSTYVQAAPGVNHGYEYARTSNPTRSVLEKNLAAIENGKYGICFASGLAAMDAIVKLLKSGDEVLATNDIYGGSYRLLTKVFAQLGISSRYIDMSDADKVEAQITDKTKILWVETPTNPMMGIADIKAIAAIGKKHKIKVVVDNTFASPYLQQPLDLGADMVLHSCTKYLGGHSDVIMGAVVTNSKPLADKLYFIQKSSGAVPGPFDCFLMLRGIKTLHVRMDRACANATKIANFLTKHPAIKTVNFPGLKDHKNHKIAKKQMLKFGAMISFSLKKDTLTNAKRVLKSTKLFSLAESLGGVESLISHPASMTHASIPKEEREKVGVTDTLIRISVGIEDVNDLIADLDFALNKVK